MRHIDLGEFITKAVSQHCPECVLFRDVLRRADQGHTTAYIPDGEPTGIIATIDRVIAAREQRNGPRGIALSGNHQRQIHLWSVDGRPPRLPQRYPAKGVGMRSRSYAYVLGVVAILAGAAVSGLQLYTNRSTQELTQQKKGTPHEQ
jgi:hypothetical protein